MEARSVGRSRRMITCAEVDGRVGWPNMRHGATGDQRPPGGLGVRAMELGRLTRFTQDTAAASFPTLAAVAKLRKGVPRRYAGPEGYRHGVMKQDPAWPVSVG